AVTARSSLSATASLAVTTTSTVFATATLSATTLLQTSQGFVAALHATATQTSSNEIFNVSPITSIEPTDAVFIATGINTNWTLSTPWSFTPFGNVVITSSSVNPTAGGFDFRFSHDPDTDSATIILGLTSGDGWIVISDGVAIFKVTITASVAQTVGSTGLLSPSTTVIGSAAL